MKRLTAIAALLAVASTGMLSAAGESASVAEAVKSGNRELVRALGRERVIRMFFKDPVQQNREK